MEASINIKLSKRLCESISISVLNGEMAFCFPFFRTLTASPRLGSSGIRSAEQAAKLLACRPKFDPKSRDLPSEIRVREILAAMRFFEPLPVHIGLEQRMSLMTRDG